MKKKMKKLLTFLLAGVMMFSTLTLTAAAEGEEYTMFLAFGGDAAADNDWGLGYTGTDTDNMTGTVATFKAGDTVTIGVTASAPVVHTWYMAPVVIAENVANLEYTIDSIKIDGEDVLDTVDLTIGDDAWWYEGTGDYTGDQAIRLKGGYNEWAAQAFTESPSGFTTIEYTITVSAIEVGAAASAGGSLVAAGADEEFPMFLAFGGDLEADNDWGLQYYGAGAGSNTGDIVATDAVAHVGDTVTIGLTMPSPAFYTWFMAPVIVAEGVGNVDFTIESITLDGVEVLDTVDLTVRADGDWWYEGTGDYGNEQAVRLAGGYNEWGDKFFAEAPTGFTEIMYTITLNAVEYGSAGGALTLSEESYPAFIAIGADKEADNDWGLGYYGGEDSGDIVVTNGELKSGETTVLSLEFPSPVFYTWFVAPTMVVPDSSVISAESTFDVKVYLDGEEIEVDLSAGDSCWAEGTGDYPVEQAVRIAGGYNEWGTKYIAESPKGFTSISFEITPEIYIAEPVADANTAAPVDLDGTYNAYLGFQTPKYSFRNAFDDASYGRDTDYFNQVTGWDADNNAVVLDGTFSDAVIAGNGTYTVSVDGLSFPDGEFDDQDHMNLIFLSTDIENSGEITISDVELRVNGTKVDLASAGAIVSPDSKDYMNILIQNTWNSDVSSIGYYAVPPTSMSITFTVSGFNYDAAPVEEEPAPVESSSETAAESSAPAESSAESTVEAASETTGSSSGSIAPIIIVVVAVVAVAVVAGVVVSKKKKS